MNPLPDQSASLELAVDALKRIAFNGDWWSAEHAAPVARMALRDMGMCLDLLGEPQPKPAFDEEGKP